MSKDFLKKPRQGATTTNLSSLSNCRPGGMSDSEDSNFSDEYDYDYADEFSVREVVKIPTPPPPEPEFLLQPLRYAILRGSQVDVESCVKDLEGFNLNDTLDGNWNALLYACHVVRPEIIAFLFEKGVDPKYSNSSKQNGLIVLACADNEDHTSHTFETRDLMKCANILIDRGVDVNAKESDLGATALHFAIKKNHVELVKFLLEKGANVNALDDDKRTPMDWAAERGFGPIIKILLRYNPDLNNINNFGCNASETAAFNDYPKIAKYLYLYDRHQLRMVEQEPDSSCLDINEVKHAEDSDRSFAERDYVEGILSHLKLRKHLAIFRKHGVKLVDFLQLDDDTLIKMGISELGDRITIIDGIRKIHNFDWKPTSIVALSISNIITLEDAVNVMKNIEFHLLVMGATIKYLADRSLLQGESNSMILKPIMQGKEENAARIVKFCQQLQTHLETLISTQKLFKSYIQKIQGNAEYRLGDYIGPETSH